MKRAEEMRACFSALVLAHAILTHCVIVNVNKGSQIIADTKEELSPLIIDSKLNEVVTIYVPIVKGTKARYYLTDPRGEERKLQIKHKQRKKIKINIEKHDNGSISHALNDNVKNVKPIKDIKIRISDRKLSMELYRTYNDTFHREHDILHKKPKRHKEYLMKLNDYKRLAPHKNTVLQSESQLNYSFTPDLTQYKQKANQQYMNVRYVNFLKQNDLVEENTEKILNKAVFKESKSNQAVNYSDLTKIEVRKIEENLSDSKTNKDVKVFLNEIVEVSNLTEYDDVVFRKKRKSSPNFNLGPLTEDDHGNWVLSVFYKDGSSWVELYQVITIHIFDNIPAEPKAIRLKQGSNFILSFSYPITHLQSCQLLSPRAASEKYYERYGLHPEYCGN
ncbi:hypothetical protein K1T71_012122 [Dendrolimus kikuchii]|uniref:Uncharacterized protein n=1 Tax=Dendrolimus kikuchii TaxID=765133 RepID=A0ACC1CL35_9NEOP|nr:hypothetical protein K1T71_012122 [Dendrolimus kikuchii]